jgi:hypothetical protein
MLKWPQNKILNLVAMTVKQLIKKLNKMPQNLQVAFRDFDMSQFEINCVIRTVSITDFSENKSEIVKFNRNDAGNQHEIRQGEMDILS